MLLKSRSLMVFKIFQLPRNLCNFLPLHLHQSLLKVVNRYNKKIKVGRNLIFRTVIKLFAFCFDLQYLFSFSEAITASLTGAYL